MDISAQIDANPPAARPAMARMNTGPAPDDSLERYVEQVLTKPDFPAFSAQIQEIMALLEDEEVSMRTLGDVVRRNYGLTLKVLQAANALGNNPTGVPIFSVESAIFRLGVDRGHSRSCR